MLRAARVRASAVLSAPVLLAAIAVVPSPPATAAGGPVCRDGITYAHETNREATVQVEQGGLLEAAHLNQSTLDRIRQVAAVCPPGVRDLLETATSLVRAAYHLNSQEMSGALRAQQEAGWTLERAHREAG